MRVSETLSNDSEETIPRALSAIVPSDDCNALNKIKYNDSKDSKVGGLL